MRTKILKMLNVQNAEAPIWKSSVMLKGRAQVFGSYASADFLDSVELERLRLRIIGCVKVAEISLRYDTN